MDQAVRPPAADAATTGAAHALVTPHGELSILFRLVYPCGQFNLTVCQEQACHFQVLVTGSLYLVGDVLRLLGKAPS